MAASAAPPAPLLSATGIGPIRFGMTLAQAEQAAGARATLPQLERIRSTHPEAQLSAHKYDANGHYLTFPGADGRAALILEVSGGKVTKVRAGLQPAVAYVETCG